MPESTPTFAAAYPAGQATRPPERTPRNLHLQILRGIAATMVVLYHAAHFTALETDTPWLGEAFGPRLGFYGVLMFFVLSGYLMQGAIQRYPPGRFLAHRLVRLYPTYWALVVILLLAQLLRTGQLQHIQWSAWTLLPFGEMYRPLGVEWTLLYEVFFYLVCTLLCFVPRFRTAFFASWLVLVLFTASIFQNFGTTFQPTWLQIPFSLWNVGFIAGALLGRFSKQLSRIAPEILVLVAIPCFLLGELVGPAPRILFAVAGLCCITQIAIVRSRLKPDIRGLGMRAWVQVGEYSYGLYLAHSMSIQIALQYTSPTASQHPVATFSAVLGVGLTIGLVAGKCDFELYRRLKMGADILLQRLGSRMDSVKKTI